MKWPLKLYKVAGPSMLPNFQPGDIAIGWRWFRPRPGQVVVAHTDIPLIKRVKSTGPAQIWLEGDNPTASTDSRHFGPLPISKIEAVILTKF